MRMRFALEKKNLRFQCLWHLKISLPSEYIDQHRSPLAAGADQMEIFQQDSS